MSTTVGARLAPGDSRRVHRAAARPGRQARPALGTRDRRVRSLGTRPLLCARRASTGHDRAPGLVRHALPVPGEPERRRCDDDTPRPRARVPDPAQQARRELRRRRHAARSRKPRRAEGGRRTRRKPPHRVRRPTDQLQPVLDKFLRGVLAAGALSPLPGDYAIVFDSGSRAGAGSFTFRYWVNDVTPPRLRLRTPSVAGRQPLRVQATDAGAGVYGASIVAMVDGYDVRATFHSGVVSISTRKPRARDAPAAAPGVRLPGVQEHRERRAHPPEHALADRHLPRSASARYFCRSRSSMVGSASRSRWTERMNSSLSSSGVMTSKLLLAALSLAIPAGSAAEAPFQARLLDRDRKRGRKDEQHEPRPAHGPSLASSTPRFVKPRHETPASGGRPAASRRPL